MTNLSPIAPPMTLQALAEGNVLEITRSGKNYTTWFGTSDVRDLSDGVLPCSIWRVDIRSAAEPSRPEEREEDHIANVRTEKQRARRVREAQRGWRSGWRTHVEIRKGAV